MELNINKKDKIHFIGIGGIGMSGIALILKKMGYDVQGSDISKKNKNLISLKKHKIKLFYKHHPSNIKNSKIIVISSAIGNDNAELKYALTKNILIIKRADMLAHIISLKKNIVISGSHGKTTITSLVSTILKDANFKPTIINGGIINSLKTNATLGDGDWTVIEADESDGSFLKFNNTLAIASNIDYEHMDYYKNFKNLKDQFAQFLNKTPLFGKNIICLDDQNLKKIKQNSLQTNFLTYGFRNEANFVPHNIVFSNMKIKFDLKVNIKKKIVIKNIILNLMGKHNVLNATAAIIVGITLGISLKKIKNSLQNFLGVQRRLTKLFEDKKRIIFDDYAHHPTEIEAVLDACKSNFKNKKIISIFQPHRYSRVNSLYKEFTQCFSNSNLVVLCPIYSAGEKIIKFDLEKFARNITKNSNTDVIIVNDQNNLYSFLHKNSKDEEIIIAMGAGSISQWIRIISEKLTNEKFKY